MSFAIPMADPLETFNILIQSDQIDWEPIPMDPTAETYFLEQEEKSKSLDIINSRRAFLENDSGEKPTVGLTTINRITEFARQCPNAVCRIGEGCAAGYSNISEIYVVSVKTNAMIRAHYLCSDKFFGKTGEIIEMDFFMGLIGIPNPTLKFRRVYIVIKNKKPTV